MTSSASTRLTYEDYATFPDDGRRHEIIEGEHYVSPSPGRKHQEILRRLLVAMSQYLQQNPIGEVFSAPFDVVLSDIDIVQPDLVYVARERASMITEKNVQGAPDLVVEILSESTRRTDAIVKRKRYDHFGVEEYWIVDPVVETIEVLRQAESGFERAAELRSETGGRLETPLLPGFSIDLSGVFHD
ncbi:MAG TPA: Uma2 family endonuclease [Thermoanaerobaculia bacterium]|nr:Uma2 family endonuclease [Thermoanaerobaculia bacterium]